MKLLSTYVKEMLIALRGFYFYIEIVMAVIILTILLAAVKEYPESKESEFIFFDLPAQAADAFFAEKIKEGTARYADDALFKLKAQKFETVSKETGGKESFSFEKTDVTVKTAQIFDRDGKLSKTVYIAETAEDMIRLAFSEKKIGSRVFADESGQIFYEYFIQGYETERMQDLLYILHSGSAQELRQITENTVVIKQDHTETLNNRQNLIPPLIVLTGSVMGFFIVIAYVYLDKSEGVIKAFAVTPSPVWKYLFSKTLVIMTTVLLSCSVITVPVMRTQVHYPLFYLLLLISTFAFAALGLLVASFFDSMTKSFGVLFGGMMVMMIPMLAYFVPLFDVWWIRILPTYPLMRAMKEAITVNGDFFYILLCCFIFAIVGLALFLLSCRRFAKTLTL